MDKTSAYRLGLWLSTLKQAFAFKPFLRQSPPFCYHFFSQDAEQYLLKSLTNRNTYKTSLVEYKHTHLDETIAELRNAIRYGALGRMPIRLITHGSSFYTEELMKYAGLDRNTSGKIEEIWQEVMMHCMTLSADSMHSTAPRSGHYIHLTDFELVRQTVLTLI